MGKKHLIIPDVHVEPGQNFARRIIPLGKLIADEAPDVVWCAGDWASMDSLSSYDKGRKSHEGRRYKKDIRAANEALDMLENEIAKKRHKPRKVLSWGNHEERIDRAIELNSELDEAISKDDIAFKEHGWETYEFLDIIAIDGVHYTHYFPSGIMGRPIGGENPAASMLKKHYVSCVAAHSHLWDFAERTRPDGSKILGVVSGWYGEAVPAYARATAHMWWSGITILEEVKNGNFDHGRISLKRIIERFK